MELFDELKSFATRVENLKENIQTEEATKTSMIMPFFSLLGYDVFNPLEFCPEFTADVGIKKKEKVDYAILKDGNPVILIECKSASTNLEKHDSQLFRYFATTTAKFGILTNGIVYRFYTDLEETNKMDLAPFMEINLLDLKEAQVNELRKFNKDNFDEDKIKSTASDLKYSNLIKAVLLNDMDNPSDEFIKYILSYVHEGARTQPIIEKFKPIIKKSFTLLINDIVNKKISSALIPDGEQHTEESQEELEDVSTEKESKIVTTEEELQSYYIIKAMVGDEVDIKHITFRDVESYFGVLFDDSNRKPICRLQYTKTQMNIQIPTLEKDDRGRTGFEKYPMNSIDDLYKYKTQLIEVAKRYL
jgi:hypothetical protein